MKYILLTCSLRVTPQYTDLSKTCSLHSTVSLLLVYILQESSIPSLSTGIHWYIDWLWTSLNGEKVSFVNLKFHLCEIFWCHNKQQPSRDDRNSMLLHSYLFSFCKITDTFEKKCSIGSPELEVTECSHLWFWSLKLGD